MPDNPDVRIDTDNLFKWDVITTYRDESGVIQGKVVDYDDGSRRDEFYTNGTLDRIVTLDADAASGGSSLFPWESMTTYFDANGDRVAFETIMDDGVVKLKLYENGVITQSTTTDQFDTQFFQSIVEYYDVTGALQFRETTYDDGVVTGITYDNGIKVQETRSDNLDTKGWSQIDIYNDQTTGQTLFRSLSYDNGVVREEEYTDGALAKVTTTDSLDAYAYAVTETYYANGLLAFKTQQMDNGIQRDTTYNSAGKRETMVQIDNNDAKAWAQIDTLYDQNGVILQSTTDLDNGVESRTVFQGGVRNFREETDWFNANSWRSKTTNYDQDGDVTDSKVVFDNNDEQITVLAPDGTRDFMIIIDGNESHSWAVRVKDFDALGQNPINTDYASTDDVPDPYALYLGGPGGPGGPGGGGDGGDPPPPPPPDIG